MKKNTKSNNTGTPKIILLLIILSVLSISACSSRSSHLAIQQTPLSAWAYTNNQYQNHFQVNFGKKDTSSPTLEFKHDKTSMEMGLKNTKNKEFQKIEKNKKDSLIIENVYQDIDLSYQITEKGLKEEIIIKNPTDQNQFEFSLSLKGLSAKKENGLWHFYNKEDKELFFIPKPFMEDANGEKSENVRIDIKDNKLIVTADKEWLLSTDRKYPITIDPSLQLIILTVHSHPQKGDIWEVKFETAGRADLKIIPNDQATIDDDEFQGLYCGDKKITPQILDNDVIFVKNWQCGETAKVIHYTKKAGDHTLRFEFGGQTAYAYNSESTYNFVGVSQESNDYYAYEKAGVATFTNQDDTGDSEATNTDYDNIESSDGYYTVTWTTDGAATTGHYDSQIYKFYIAEDEADITQLDFTWEGYGETHGTGYPTDFYAWNYNTSAWVLLDEATHTGGWNQDLTGSKTTDAGNYIDADKEVTLMVKTKKYVAPTPTPTPPPESCCYDGVDNNSDGDTDCEDISCSGAYDTGGGDYIFCADTYMWSETLASAYEWGCETTTISGANSLTDGQQNTIDILAGCAERPIAASACDSLNYGGFTDWYLPAKTTMSNLYGDITCSNCSSWDTYCCDSSSPWPEWHWTSTEYTHPNYAWGISFNTGSLAENGRHFLYSVRCQRD